MTIYMSESLSALSDQYIALIRSFLDECKKEKIAPNYVNELLRVSPHFTEMQMNG